MNNGSDKQTEISTLYIQYTDLKCFNPISAGVLENQDMLGGGQFDPPLNPMFDVQI